MTIPARAEWQIQPYATSDYVQDSNVFALSEGAVPPMGKDGPTRSDSMLRYGAGVDSHFEAGNQRLDVKAGGGRQRYRQLSHLDHTTYVLDNNFEWRLPAVFDGSFAYLVQRRAASIMDINTIDLLLETERLGKLTLNMAIGSEWTLGGSYQHRTEDSPQPGAPGLSVTERTTGARIEYEGPAGWTVGLRALQLDGEFEGITGPFAAPYEQYELRLASNYGDGLHIVAAEIGTTRRTQSTAQDVDAVTGLLAYNRTLSVKTSLTVQYDRGIETNLINTDAVIGSGTTLGVNWNATEKTSLALSYAWRRNEFAGQPADRPEDGDRTDRYQQAVLDVKYQLTSSLQIHPYARYQTRRSNAERFQFDGHVWGVQLEARVP